jgi:uncharacterized protein (TIGR03437 family)
MAAGLLLLAALVSGFFFRADAAVPPAGPNYTAAGIVNAADYKPGPLAPNTIATIFGTGLAYGTRGLLSSDMQGGLIPTVLPGTGVHVIVGGLAAGIYYVSPTQINFLVPSILLPGSTTVTVALNGIAGPTIPVQIAAGAPAFFQLDTQSVIATRPDASVVTADNPASPGDTLILYATGMGQVVPPLSDREVPLRALAIKQLSDLKVNIDGVPLDASFIAYAGVCPGFAGLYQVNLRLPDTVNPNPEIQVSLSNNTSPPGLRLWIQSK